ncbi:MAG: GtrA family protein [Pseudomonadales bacterium]|nr:GtrA family protein [Pseudomonadales bacterium]
MINKLIEKYPVLKLLLRYIVGGLSTTVICWGSMYYFIEYQGIHYIISNNLSVALAYCYSFFINKILVFKDDTGDHVVKGSSFLALQLSLLAGSNLLLYIGVDMLGLHYFIMVLFSAVLAAIINFLIMHHFIFNKKLV